MKLPYLKNRRMPRIADQSDETMTDSDDPLEQHCVKELIEAVGNKDVKAFRAALEALILNCFDDGDEDDGQ